MWLNRTAAEEAFQKSDRVVLNKDLALTLEVHGFFFLYAQGMQGTVTWISRNGDPMVKFDPGQRVTWWNYKGNPVDAKNEAKMMDILDMQEDVDPRLQAPDELVVPIRILDKLTGEDRPGHWVPSLQAVLPPGQKPVKAVGSAR